MIINKPVLVSLISLVVVGELVWGIIYLKPNGLPFQKSSAESGAVLSLEPNQKVLHVGEETEIAVVLDTKSNSVSGADLIINFDPALVEIKDVDGVVANGIQIRPGILFPNYPVNTVDSKNGRIGFSAAALAPSSFMGKGTLAYITIKPLRAGQTALTVEYEKGKTDDSNVVKADSQGADILDKVIQARYSVID